MNTKRKLLIVIDMQEDFVYGSLANKDAEKIIPGIKEKIENYLKNDDQVVFTRDTHRANYLETPEGKALPIPHCIHGTKGWTVVDDLSYPLCKHIDKTSFGHKYWDIEMLDDYSEIEIVGTCTSICVVSNALIIKAMYPNIPITVDSSCCACINKESHEAALTVMRNCQINVI